MKITLNQEEIHQAVEAFVRTQITIAANQEVSIDFTAGRGENGLTASLDIRTMTAPAPVAVIPPKAVPRSLPLRPVAAPAEAKEVPEAPQAEAIEEAVTEAVVPEPTETTAAEPELAEEPRPVSEAPKKASIFSKAAAVEPKADAEPVEDTPPRPAGKSIFSRAEG